MQTRESHPPIADYALIGNRDSCALIDREGNVDWCCLPCLDDPSVFGAILDLERGGHWRVGPADRSRSSRSYAGMAPVLITEFQTASGILRLTDFQPIRPGADGRPSESAHSMVRIAECTAGEVEVAVDWKPRPDYGRADVRFEREGDAVRARSGSCDLWLRGVPRATTVDHAGARVRMLLRAGERLPLITGTGPPRSEPVRELADILLQETLSWWRDWDARCRVTPGAEPWDELTMRSGMVLKLLSSERTGAIAAAPTTSLPEEIGGVRNWDYRFCWVRDASMTSRSLLLLGQKQEGIAFLEFLERAAQQHDNPARVQVLFGLSGETKICEQQLDHLTGYRGSRPVRIGNAAADQRQLDVYGELLDAAYDLVQLGVELKPDQRDWLRSVADHACAVWRLEDSGIWEVRGPERHFTYSKLMCWVALDRAIALAPHMGWGDRVGAWGDERTAIRHAIMENGFDRERNAFVQSFGSRTLDAASLLIPRTGFLPATDPRVVGTVDATLRELTVNGLVRRYDTDQAEDGLEGSEGAFGLCTFWLADALALAGRVDEAREVFDGIAGRANDLGLLPEQFDPYTGEFLGNFPQAFTHLGLINSTACLGSALAGRDRGEPPAGRAAIRTGTSGDTI